MANVTTVTFNYMLVAVFLFPLNVGVSPGFHCTREQGRGACMSLKKGGIKKERVGDDTPFCTMFCDSNVLCFWIQDKS